MYRQKILEAKENEFFLKNGKPYNGFYYYKGNFPYTYIPGGTYEEILLTYNQITLAKMKRNIRGGHASPLPILPSLTIEYYASGRIVRYFSQKRVAPLTTIVEISENQFITATLGDSSKALNLNIYKTISIDWIIKGKVDYVSTTNTSTLKAIESQFNGITTYLKNPLQFFKNDIG